MPVDAVSTRKYRSRTTGQLTEPNDFKINAGIGLRPSTIARLKAAAEVTGRSKSDLAEEFILAGLDNLVHEAVQ